MKTRDEIINAIVTAYRADAAKEASESYGDVDYENIAAPDDKEYEEIIRETLTAKLASLRPDEMVRTCEDFGRLGIECCEACHTYYPHYELALLNLESGGQAWICCALGRALNPQRHQKLVESADYREIEEWFGD